MTEERRRELEKMLEEKRLTLIRSATATFTERRNDAGDRLELEREGHFDLSLAMASAGVETVSKIELALVRLRDGSYGCCYDCGGEIESPRLRALPFAELCKGCEEKKEALDPKTSILPKRFQRMSVWAH